MAGGEQPAVDPPSPLDPDRGHEPDQADARRDARRILDHLRGRVEEMVGRLEALAGAESPSRDPETHEAARVLVGNLLRDSGLDVETIPGRDVGAHLLARSPGAGADQPYQLLLGHLDTVWPIGTLSTMPLRIEDGRLHGPGVYDMKGGLVQGAFALQALRATGLRPALPIVAFVNSDEEIGSPDSGDRIRRLAAKARRALVLEPSFGPSGRLKTARKGVGRFTVTVKGHASHAGIDPERGSSAILEISHQVQRLFELNDRERGITVNVGTIGGGTGANVIAPEVHAAVDARVVEAADAEELDAAIRALRPVGEGVEVEVEGGFERPPLERTPRNRGLWAEAQRAAEMLGIEIDEALVGGASDGNLASGYTATLDGLGAVGDGAHADHEHVTIEAMAERAALVALLTATSPAEGEG